FLEILAALKGCGYRVRARLLDAQWLGVPQMRQRLIFIGVRNDLRLEPAFPKPLPYRYSVRDALPWLESVSCLLPGQRPGTQPGDLPSPTVTTSDTGSNGRHFVEAETDISRFAIGREWDNVPQGGKSEKYINLCKPALDEPCNCVTAPAGMTSAAT